MHLSSGKSPAANSWDPFVSSSEIYLSVIQSLGASNWAGTRSEYATVESRVRLSLPLTQIEFLNPHLLHSRNLSHSIPSTLIRNSILDLIFIQFIRPLISVPCQVRSQTGSLLKVFVKMLRCLRYLLKLGYFEHWYGALGQVMFYLYLMSAVLGEGDGRLERVADLASVPGGFEEFEFFEMVFCVSQYFFPILGRDFHAITGTFQCAVEVHRPYLIVDFKSSLG